MADSPLLRPIPPRNTIPEILRLLPDDLRIRSLRAWLGFESPHVFYQNATALPYETGPEVNLSRAWYFAEASLLAYYSEADTRAALGRVGFNVDCYIEARKFDGDMFICSNQTDVWVVYRGTEPTDPHDWIIDFRWNQVNVEAGKTRIHNGFYRQFSDLEATGSVGAWLRENLGTRRVWFVGHSLGGALASFALYYYTLGRHQVVPIDRARACTFGCPLVGNIHFADAVRPYVKRYVHDNDLAARNPPIGGYHPAGKLTFIAQDGEISERDELPPITAFTFQDLFASLRAVPELLFRANYGRALGQLDPIFDHSMLYYITHIWNQAILAKQA